VPSGLPWRCSCRLKFGETATDLHLVLGGLLPEVRHHLRVNFTRNQAPLPIQHADRLIFRQVALQVLHHLAREVVEQIGMGEVVDIIEVHQCVDDVVLGALLLEADLGCQRVLLVGVQVMDHDSRSPGWR
jgi:hypothetical protein